MDGWNVLAGVDAAGAAMALARAAPAYRPELYGDGHAADRVVAAIGEHLGSRPT